MTAAPRSPADRRAQILDVAMRLLDSVPFEQLSMDQVAAEAGVSSPLLFHYFKNKHGFRNAVLVASATELQRRMTPDTSLPLPAQLRAGVETFAEAVIAHPAIYLAVMRMASSGDHGMRKIYRGMRRTFTRWIGASLAELGVSTTPALEAAISGWQALMEEIVLSWLDEPTMDRTDMIDLCERAFYHLLPAAGVDVDALDVTR
ncbi:MULTISPECIES: TetR/AcrR family transcriptional regulator [Rhodococcus]|uniref:TetR/AcrR family transcriptional regulator n=2 Tax=Rhodococcus TaxID=1827 RepID=A0AAE4UYJ9_9NOCA|nr:MULTISPECIES: TetR/AcrR family transcriptional regulator [Rhodococcus]MDV7245902.1 TetR/AcrR family transcriptional regulator [Rhodococcus oxybenzonivorans]MDV7265331.1 TetR/AcrR family transcriptional regulator [Rhodococcus oxybenzonivorans]MDV7277294.1 TetR/AcrR family transcriptional regulator [Rhodococcus oxybenzonivorans]MDV7336864.1 TetR/AcrR family transcriptional regulator [Rhodococcus oxybenzonivorans]MDV7347006.1 TetR/AcrR family transcriptional regulator [Rhodococcus oxybenzonivo